MNQPSPILASASAHLRYLSNQRQRLGIWIVGARTASNSPMKSLAGQLGVRYIDLLVELMSDLGDTAGKPLGVFGPDDLDEWIRRRSYEPLSPPILIDAIEPILATFSKPEAIGFFRLAANSNARAPVVVVSHLGALISAAGFPSERIWQITDEGSLWRT